MKRYFAIITCAVLLLTAACTPKQAENANSSTKETLSSEAVEVTQNSQGSDGSEESSAASDTEEVSVIPASAESSDTSDTEESIQELSVIPESNENTDIIESPLCSAAVLYCADDDRFIYNDSSEKRIAPASITKLLTAAVVMKYMDPDDVVTVGTEQYFVNEDSSVCFLSIGNRLTVRDLLTGMLLSSGNDAAYTAAVSAARDANPDKELSDDEAVTAFCGMMNELAGEIGMTGSHFSDPDGWDEDDHYVTAADLVKLSAYVLRDPVIREIVGTHQKYVEFVSGENITWTNTNSLLDPDSSFYCDACIGLKTGTTDNAGCCLAAAFTKNEKTYITVVSGCAESDERYELTLKLFERAE